MSNRSTAITSLKHNLSINLGVIRQRVRDARAYIKAFAQWSPIYAKRLVQHSLETPTPLPRNISTHRYDVSPSIFRSRVLVSGPSRDLSSCHYRQITNGTEAAPPRVIENYGTTNNDPYFFPSSSDGERERRHSGNST